MKLAQTPIGAQLRNSPERLAVACMIGYTTIIVDLILVWLWWNSRYKYAINDGRWLITVTVSVANIHLARGDLSSIGLIAKPIQGWGYWVWATLFIGLAVLCCSTVGWSAWIFLGRELPVPSIPPNSAARVFMHMCLVMPVVEEPIYRLALCVPLAGSSRPWMAVVVSGLTFGVMHIFGNPSPENLVGGLFLAWAYLKSGTIYIPVLLHSLGNFVAWAVQVAAWYWLQGMM